MEPFNQARAILGAELLELWPVICSIIGLYYNSPTNSIYLSISWEPRPCQQLAHSILLSQFLMEPLNQARASLGAQRLELWPVICSTINLYYNSPKHRIYLAISWEPRLCQQLAHSTLLSLLFMEPLNQAPAILVAELLELCPVKSSIIILYYNSPTNSIYLIISCGPSICWKLAHSTLLSLLFMEPLNQAPAILVAELLELCPVISSIIILYYNSPTNSIYLIISWGPSICWKLAHSILLSLLLIEPLNQARASLVAQLLELCPVICSIIINLYYNSPTNRIYLAISWEPRVCLQLVHSILLSLLLMKPLNKARASLVAELLELWPVICSTIGLY
jgi:hypothetical protein